MKLDDAAYQRLRDMKRKQGHRRDYIKITVVLMLHRGRGPGGIAACLGIMEQAMANYQERFEIFGLGPYPADHYRPYGRKLTEAQKEPLTAELDTNFYQTSREICAFVMEESGGGYRPGGLMPLLHKLGFSHKKTNTIPCGADGRPR